MTSPTRACIRKTENGDYELVIQHAENPEIVIKVSDFEDAKDKIEKNLDIEVSVKVLTIDVNNI